ncbi:MAG: four helix bundle protein [Candidatus Taylorbacteria bacterium]|nr:four helix bundle protein [Candidatus Taylorbacteria bacterium]
MTEIQNSKKYDLEDRTLSFTKEVVKFVSNLPKTTANFELGKQLIRSAGSVGANYIEANESLSKKDFLMRIKICRKEAKETRYWLKILDENGSLTQESNELMKIFGAILEKSK